MSLEFVINNFLKERDYPFHSWAFLSYPKYIDKISYFKVESKVKKTIDYIFYIINPVINKPSLNDPVFILSLKQGICTIYSLPYTELNSHLYKPNFKSTTKDSVFAAIKLAKILNVPHIYMEDNTYIVGLDDKCIPYSDLLKLFTDKTWYQTFLPIKVQVPINIKSWYQIKDLLGNQIKDLIEIPQSDAVRIGSGKKILKSLAKNLNIYTYMKNNLEQILYALDIKSLYKAKYVM
jgi:hypothetical protein